MDHNVMFLILAHLAESKSATSRDVAQKFSFISPKYASLVLTRCHRRKFVSRKPYKRGREHGYIYKLTNKGAEWVLYKHSQRTKEDQRDRKPLKQVGNKGIPVQNIMTSKTEGTRQENEASTFPILTSMSLYSNRYQLRDFLADLGLLRLFSGDDFTDYFCLEQMRKSSDRIQKERTITSSVSLRGSWSPASETTQRFESRSVLLQEFKLGLKLGIAIGKTMQLMQTQDALQRTILKKFESRNLSNTNITMRQMTSAKTSKIEKPIEAVSKFASTPHNIAVEEPREDDNWAGINDWWRHLPES